MSEYTDFWKSLDLPADQSPKIRDFNIVASNSERLSLTPAEQYSLGWGPDAVPEDWVKAKAKEINDQIQAAESTAILKRGLVKGDKTQEEIDAEAAAKALEDAKAKEAVNTPGAPQVENGGGSGDVGPSLASSTPGHEASDAWDMNQYGWNASYDAKEGVKGALQGAFVAGPIGGLLGGLKGVTLREDPLAEFAYTALRAQEDRDIAAAKNGTGGNFSQADLDGFNATNDPIGALADSIGMGDPGTGGMDNGTPGGDHDGNAGTGNGNSPGSNGGGGGGGPGNDRD